MPALPPALDKLASLLARLPGIGERSATRLAFHVLSEPGGYASELARALDGLETSVTFCEDCHMVAESGLCKVWKSATSSLSNHGPKCLRQNGYGETWGGLATY